MHWKKYAILLPPFVLIGLLLLYYLPTGQKHYAILVALVFWVCYYAWVYIDRKKRKDAIEKSSVNCINK